MLKCPKCGADSYVIVTEERKDGEIVYRRRQCSTCRKRFNTKERVVEDADKKHKA